MAPSCTARRADRRIGEWSHLRFLTSRPRTQAGALVECSVWGATGRRRCQQKTGGRLCAVRAGRQGTVPAASSARATPNPRALTRAVWGLITRPPGSGGLSSGFPFARRVLPLRPPSSGFPSSGVLRLSLRPLPGSGCPSIPSGLPFPVSDLHASVAAGQFRQALVLGGTDQRHQFCRGGRLSQPCAGATRVLRQAGPRAGGPGPAGWPGAQRCVRDRQPAAGRNHRPARTAPGPA
jgi:hypothetical protein